MAIAISLDRVSKSFENKVLDTLSLQIPCGEKFLLAGSANSGKSTLIRILTGLLKPSQGTVRVLGLNPVADRRALSYKISYLFGNRTQLLYQNPVLDSFAFLAKTYRIPPDPYTNRLQKLTDLFEISDLLHKPTHSLSLEERLRCDLVASLLHEPKILFLDEVSIIPHLTILSRMDDLTVLLTSHREEKPCDLWTTVYTLPQP